MTPYREDWRAQFAELATHVGNADGLLEVNGELYQQLALMTNRSVDADRACLDTWRDLWTELDRARAILVGLGRDTKQFDAAREQAGNPLLVVGRLTPLREPMRAAARDAIAAARAAIPEISMPKIPRSAPVIIDPRSFELSRRWRLSPRIQIRLALFFLSLVATIVVIAIRG